jgi:TMEM175 potassium channel family protein
MAALRRLPALVSKYRNRLAQPPQHLSRLRGVDHGLVLLNLLLLLFVSVLPFPTSVLGDALPSGDFADQRTAALLYAGNFLFASTAFCLLWLWASRGRRLIRERCPTRRSG